MLPVQYNPKHEIITYDESIYVIDSDKLEAFKEQLNDPKVKFIPIGNTLIATSSIKTVRPAKQEISILEKLLTGESEEIKRKVREKVRTRGKEGFEETEGSIQNIIAKIKGE